MNREMIFGKFSLTAFLECNKAMFQQFIYLQTAPQQGTGLSSLSPFSGEQSREAKRGRLRLPTASAGEAAGSLPLRRLLRRREGGGTPDLCFGVYIVCGVLGFFPVALWRWWWCRDGCGCRSASPSASSSSGAPPWRLRLLVLGDLRICGAVQSPGLVNEPESVTLPWSFCLPASSPRR